MCPRAKWKRHHRWYPGRGRRRCLPRPTECLRGSHRLPVILNDGAQQPVGVTLIPHAKILGLGLEALAVVALLAAVLLLHRFLDDLVRAVPEGLLVPLAGVRQALGARLLATSIAAVVLATEAGPADDERATALSPLAHQLDEVQLQRMARAPLWTRARWRPMLLHERGR